MAPSHESAAIDSPAAPMTIGVDDVHVWWSTLDDVSGLTDSFEGVLSADERRRADRFSFPQARTRFVLSRGLLRLILSRYVGREPGRVAFSYGRYGKPALRTMPAEPALRFNASHSEELILYAVTRGREVGVDVERIRPQFPYGEVVGQFFSPSEKDSLYAMAPTRRCDWFFACWTVKEAYLKAIGRGLSGPLDRIEVAVSPDVSRVSMRVDGQPDARAFEARLLRPFPGYLGALVVEGGPYRLTCRRWRSDALG
ncbi:4'-phosphopantetheinyl transferase family protein [Candidatus Nitrospira bockiana]